MAAPAQGKILVIRGGAIGDFILTLPVLAALRAQFPQARVEVLGYRHIAQLALAGGLADAVRSIEARALAGFFARNGELDAGLQEYFGGFAVIFSYLFDPDGIFKANVARCSGAQFIAGPHRPEESAAVHATEVFLRPLERFAIFDPDPIPRLPLTPHPSRPTGCLALHPGSGSPRKNWPEANWAALLQRLAASTDWPILLVGGEAEEGRLERLAGNLPASRCALANGLPLPELAQRLRACRAFVGHDSGITHLAAALGLSTLALWGETPEAVWRPQGPLATVLRAPGGLSGLTVDMAMAALRRLLSPGA